MQTQLKCNLHFPIVIRGRQLLVQKNGMIRLAGLNVSHFDTFNFKDILRLVDTAYFVVVNYFDDLFRKLSSKVLQK